MEVGETSIRQNAIGGASSAWTTAALTTPAWVIAIAVPVPRRLRREPGTDARQQRGQGLAAVGRGVRVGHPGVHARLVGLGDLAQGAA